jgi:ankyrin repeat protein
MPLHGAAYGGKRELVQLLLDKGADVDVVAYDQGTPL